MKRVALIFLFILSNTLVPLGAQNTVDIDGRLQPILDDFFKECDAYGIAYHDKLFQLKEIDISSELPLEEGNTVLGKVTRNAEGKVERILINWAAMLDPEILKVVAFHEFAHHFLDYKHTCEDCNEIMAVRNSSYFEIAANWSEQVEQLFITSPSYLARFKKETVAAITLE